MANPQTGGGCARGGHGIGVKRAPPPRATLAALLTSASLGVFSLAMPAVAQVRAESVTFDIPAQPINEALVTFARQASVRLVMPDAQFGNVRSNPVRGAYDRESALAELLRGTGVAARLENGAIVLQRSADASRASQGAAPDASGEPVQLAQATSPGASAADAAADLRRGVSNDTDDDGDADKVIIVGTNIRGIYPSSSPVEIFTAQDIARSGAATTDQFIQKLPQNLGTRSLYGTSAVRSGGPTGTSNQEGIAAVDLRGLGLGTTLVLLNGRRIGLSDFGRAVDVSLIPIEAIDRIEVLNDGASAIYGSEAVGGVVNFVLRDDFDGQETRLSYGGVTNGGLRQGDLSHTLGGDWVGGHGLVSYNYFSASALDVADRDYAAAADRGALTPIIERQSLLATFSQNLSEQLVLSGDLALARREMKDEASGAIGNPQFWTESTTWSDTDQYFANLALDYEISDELRAAFMVTSSRADFASDSINRSYNLNPVQVVTGRREKQYSLYDLTATVDGILFSLPGGPARFSVGGGYLEEEYSGAALLSSIISTRVIGRSTTYGFGELFLPLIGSAQDIPLVHRLEVSLAGRYTRYDDKSEPALSREFGDSTDPKAGLLWAPFESLGLRATYGTSFRAPSLSEIDELGGRHVFFNNIPVPFPTGSPNNLIIVNGVPAPNLSPESAETYTLGFDLRPSAHPQLQISGTYYSITYSDRIGVAPANGAAYLMTPDLYPLVIYRPPSAAFIEQILRTTVRGSAPPAGVSTTDPAAAAQTLFAAGNTYIVDQRARNLALSEQDGFDVSFRNAVNSDWGEVRYGGNITKILSYRQQASATSAVVSVVDKATQPVDLRARSYVGLTRGDFDGTLSINYVDDYSNPFAPSGGGSVGSWTTVDLSMSYDLDSTAWWRRGTRLTLSVQNVFDKDPPFVQGGGSSGVEVPLGFDPVNANPLGRFVVFGISRRW